MDEIERAISICDDIDCLSRMCKAAKKRIEELRHPVLPGDHSDDDILR